MDLRARLKEIEQHFIEGALQETNGSQTKAGKLLGMTQQCLSNKLRAARHDPAGDAPTVLQPCLNRAPQSPVYATNTALSVSSASSAFYASIAACSWSFGTSI
jgi:hypothetical protein